MDIKRGGSFTLILKPDGQVIIWLHRTRFLPICPVENETRYPTLLKIPSGLAVKQISQKTFHAAIIDIEGNVFIWGFNYSEALGINGNHNLTEPTRLAFFNKKEIKNIYCEMGHTFALTQNGVVYGWGVNNNRLGCGMTLSHIRYPTLINFPNSVKIEELYTGYNHTFAVSTHSEIYSWGNNNNYQLCNGNNISQNIPTLASKLKEYKVQKILCASESTMILTENKLYSIGYSEYGSLGLGNGIDKSNTLKQIIFESDDLVEDIYGGAHTILCKMTNGNIYSWGLNSCGELGVGDAENRFYPEKINMPQGLNIRHIFYGDGCTYAVTIDEKIYTWGYNSLIDDYEIILKPTLLTYFEDNNIDI